LGRDLNFVKITGAGNDFILLGREGRGLEGAQILRLCGNGARCALEYASSAGFVGLGEKARFRFDGSVYSGTVLAPGLARFEFSPAYEMRDSEGIEAEGVALRGSFAYVGSLHFVIDVASIRGLAGEKGYFGVDDVPVEEVRSADLDGPPHPGTAAGV
jgi:diaminopimelate epimerase